jgi:FG-GAP-like repeat
MLGLADRLRLLALLLASQALGACAVDAHDPLLLGAARERLDESPWIISDIGDFNGDGMWDLLWNEAGKSTMAIWLMAGTDVLLPGPLVPGPPGADWRVAWAADFNGDGLSDARWDNAATRQTAIWLMAGTALSLAGPAFSGPPGDGWDHDGSADFNGDGLGDLLWRNTSTHAAEVWFMSGTAPLLQGPVLLPPLGDGWRAEKSADFNGDGLADVLWTNATTRSISIGLMSGTTKLLQGPTWPMPPGDGWVIVTAPDLNGDGMADVLWFNEAKHAITTWLMNGTEIALIGPEIPAPPGDGWIPVNTGDLNADDMSDVVWENAATNRFIVWLMTGTEVLLPGPEIPGPGGA